MAISPLDKDKEPSSSSSCLPSLVESINNYNSIAGNFAAQKGGKKRSDVEKSEKEHVYCLFTPKGMSAHDGATSHQRKKKKMECVARQKKFGEGKKRLVGTLGAPCHFPPPPSISLQVVTFTQTKTPSPVKGAEGKESQLSHADLNPFFSEGGKEAKLGSQSDGRKSLGARPSARRKNFVPLLVLLPSCCGAHLTSRRRHLKSGNIF